MSLYSAKKFLIITMLVSVFTGAHFLNAQVGATSLGKDGKVTANSTSTYSTESNASTNAAANDPGASIKNTDSCSATLATFADIVGFIVCVINRFIIPILVTLAVGLFLYGIAVFILNAGNTEERAHGRQFMIWGIIALFTLVSVWGILKFLAITFGFGADTIIPQFK